VESNRLLTTATATPADVTDDPPQARWLMAVVRVGVALLWIQNLSWKAPPDFGKNSGGGLYKWAKFAVDKPVFGPYARFVEHVVLPNFTVFGWLTLLVEAGLGAFLLVGLATRLWALIGIAQSVAIALSVLNAPHEWHWAYFLMILAHVALFATAAGRSFGVDGVLRPTWRASSGRVARVLLRVS